MQSPRKARTMISLKVNGQIHSLDVEPQTPLLWVLRDTIGLTGTKFGCGAGLCGACTVHVNGRAVRSCTLPVNRAQGSAITTIEGLGGVHPVQQAGVEGSVPGSGCCQSGQVMAAVALISKKRQPTDADIKNEVTNLCRCGTYLRIRQAIHRAAEISAKRG